VGGDGEIHATWSRQVGPVTILAFGDRSYTLILRADHKPPLLEIGWSGWRPNFISFPRWRPL
jgi:hypothetical protein